MKHIGRLPVECGVDLQEQIMVDLAGRAAERLLLGDDEISSLNMASISHARSVVHMLVLGSGMADNPAIGPQVLAHPYKDSETSGEVDMYLGEGTPLETATAAQIQMEKLLHEVPP
jgi:ATP-dependent Zn protease